MSTSGRSPQLGEAFGEVLIAARANAPWAFDRLFRAYSPAVASYARRQRTADPDGTVNDVFLDAFRGLAGFAGDESGFRAWLFTIAHRRVVDERRRMSRRVSEELGDISAHHPGGDVEEEALGSLGTQRVQRLLGDLVPDQRDVLLLRILGDLTIEQVADALGRSIGATKALQRRGLLALRRNLEREGVPL